MLRTAEMISGGGTLRSNGGRILTGDNQKIIWKSHPKGFRHEQRMVRPRWSETTTIPLTKYTLETPWSTSSPFKPLCPNALSYILILSFNLSTGWQLSIWNYCKPFFSLLINCQLLCFWRLALSIIVEVFPQHIFSGYCSSKDVYYKLVMPNCMPYPWVASVF